MNDKTDSDRLTRVITDSAHQIWSAGLGALSLAEKEGSKFFESLTKLGESIHSRTMSTADVAKQTVSGGKAAAAETWDKLEEMFEMRVARVLNRMQIPTAQDVQELSERVDRLAQAVTDLSAAHAAAEKKKGRKKKSGKKKKKKKSSAKKKKKSASKKKKKSGKKSSGS